MTSDREFSYRALRLFFKTRFASEGLRYREKVLPAVLHKIALEWCRIVLAGDRT